MAGVATWAMPNVLSSALSRSRLALAGLVRAEPLLLLGLAPLLWFPRPWSGWLVLIIPLLWLLRWRLIGRLSVRTPYDVPVACLLAVLPLTALPIVEWSAAATRYQALLLGLALVYALANALSTWTWVVRGALATIVLLGGGLALLGLIGTEWPTSKLLPFDSIYERLPKLVRGVAYATPTGAVHANEMGGVLTPLVPLALATLLGLAGSPEWSERVISRVVGTVTVLLAGVLMLTQSRSAYVGTAIGVIVVLGWWVATRAASPRVRTAAFGLLLLGAGLAGWATWRLVTTWSGADEMGSTTLPGRAELWNRSLYMLQDFPLTGIGLGQFSLVLHALYVPFLLPPGTWVAHAHNIFLQLGLDLGIPGAVAMLFVIGAFLRSMWRTAGESADPLARALAVGLGAGMLAFLVYGLTDAISVGARGAIVLWVVLGLGAALGRVAGPAEDSPDHGARFGWHREHFPR